MDESTSSPATTDVPSAAPRRLRGLTWLFGAFVVAGGVLWLWWILFGSNAGERRSELEASRAQIELLTRSDAQLRSSLDALRARLDDGDKVDKSIREQLLALSERVRLAEDAVANLADKRLSGRDGFALDTAELLLNLGGQRFVLFHDSSAAVAAYRQADNALGEVEDATFSAVRQSIAAEIAAFEDAHAADAAALALRLAQLREHAAQAPAASGPAAPQAAASDSRFWRMFDTFVQVRHVDANAEVALRSSALARELFQIDLREAEAAALARDAERYRAALDSARRQLDAGFAAEARTALARELDGLAKAPLAPPAPAVFGMALKELRNLRTTHALRESKPHGDAK